MPVYKSNIVCRRKVFSSKSFFWFYVWNTNVSPQDKAMMKKEYIEPFQHETHVVWYKSNIWKPKKQTHITWERLTVKSVFPQRVIVLTQKSLSSPSLKRRVFFVHCRYKWILMLFFKRNQQNVTPASLYTENMLPFSLEHQVYTVKISFYFIIHLLTQDLYCWNKENAGK